MALYSLIMLICR